MDRSTPRGLDGITGRLAGFSISCPPTRKAIGLDGWIAQVLLAGGRDRTEVAKFGDSDPEIDLATAYVAPAAGAAVINGGGDTKPPG